MKFFSRTVYTARSLGVILLLLAYSTIGHAQTFYPTVPAQPTNTPSVERYLARAIYMRGISDGINIYSSGLDADIEKLTYIKASFVGGLFGAWAQPGRFNLTNQFNGTVDQRYCYYISNENRWVPYSRNVLTELKYTIDRINAAYDSKHLQRPILQASINEYISLNPDDHDLVDYISIPPSVIAAFQDEIALDASAAAYYLDSGSPKPGLKFNFWNIAYPYETYPSEPTKPTWYSPDALKIEGRMWLYYQAQCLIDSGITSLHMGQAKIWGHCLSGDVADLNRRNLTMHNINSVVSRIRTYARTRPGTNTPFVLIASEVGAHIINGSGQYIKFTDGQVNGVDQMIFDFMMPVIRPRDVLNPGIAESCSTVPRSNSVKTLETRDTMTPACANMPEVPIPPITTCGDFLATIDPCHGRGLLPDGSGRMPLGKVYTKQTPYLACFDGWDSDFAPNCSAGSFPSDRGTRNPSPPAGRPDLNYSDDGTWFMRLQSMPSCQANWIAYQIPIVRAFSKESQTFLQVAGKLGNAGSSSLRDKWDLPTDVKDAIYTAWEPVQVLQASFTSTPCAGFTAGYTVAPKSVGTGARTPGNTIKLPTWSLAITNPDAASIYTWHIQLPDGTYEPLRYGSSISFSPRSAGGYGITVQQDNLGLSPIDYPSGQRFFSYSYSDTYAYAEDCSQAQQVVKTAARLTPVPEKKFNSQLKASASAQTTVESVEVFPNPADNQVSVSIVAAMPGLLEMQLTNALGQVVPVSYVSQILPKGPFLTTINTSVLPQGVYVLSIMLNNEHVVRRFVKL